MPTSARDERCEATKLGIGSDTAGGSRARNGVRWHALGAPYLLCEVGHDPGGGGRPGDNRGATPARAADSRTEVIRHLHQLACSPGGPRPSPHPEACSRAHVRRGAGAGGVPKILDTLRQTGTPATFFMTGRFAELFPSWARLDRRPLPGRQPHLRSLGPAEALARQGRERGRQGATDDRTRRRSTARPAVSLPVRIQQCEHPAPGQSGRVHGGRLDG